MGSGPGKGEENKDEMEVKKMMSEGRSVGGERKENHKRCRA